MTLSLPRETGRRAHRLRDKGMTTEAKGKWGPIRLTAAAIGATGTVVALLANADPAIDGAKRLWARFTTSPTPLETVWQGDWSSRQGMHFSFSAEIDVAANNEATGQISWQLTGTPPGYFLEPRIGSVAIEYVSGEYDREKKQMVVTGYRVSDPTLLALDTYRLQIKPDNISFIGMTRNHGEWEAQTAGAVIVTETH
jgi:hypothetical protein